MRRGRLLPAYVLPVIALLALPAVAAPPDEKALRVLDPQHYKDAVVQTDYAAHTVPVRKFLELAQQPGAVILDLREQAAYDYAHIKGAKLLGADIEERKVAALVPDKASTVLIYCTNSLMLTRMMSNTQVALPQLLALGYKNTYLLEDAAHDASLSSERTKQLPMISTADETRTPQPQKDKQ